jgi:ferredoxin
LPANIIKDVYMFLSRMPSILIYAAERYFEELYMKATISEECVSCGLCVDICPDVFEMGEEYAQVKMASIPAKFEAAVRQAADECPVSAIAVEQ